MFFKHTSHLLLLILGYSLGIIVIYWNFFSFYTGSPLLISLSICTFLLAYFTKTRPYVFWLFCFLATFLMGSLRMEMHPSQRLFKTLHHEGKQKNTLETINPLVLFSLGFVMSYAAVASILLGMPLWNRWGFPKTSTSKKSGSFWASAFWRNWEY